MRNSSMAIGFVIYNPCQIQLERILYASRCGFQVFIYDNTPDIAISKIFFSKNINDFIYTSSGNNIGLAKSINIICEKAYDCGIKSLLFFDQDTIFNDQTLYFIENFYINNKAILSEKYSGVLFNASSETDHMLHSTDIIINSGFLFVLENFKKMGGMNNNLFVDGVDYYFSLLSQIFGYLIGEIKNTPGYDHASEQGSIRYVFFSKVYLIRKYPLKRIFDVIRANIFILILSLYHFKLKFFLKITKFLFIYLAMQLFVRSFGYFFKKNL